MQDQSLVSVLCSYTPALQPGHTHTHTQLSSWACWCVGISRPQTRRRWQNSASRANVEYVTVADIRDRTAMPPCFHKAFLCHSLWSADKMCNVKADMCFKGKWEVFCQSTVLHFPYTVWLMFCFYLSICDSQNCLSALAVDWLKGPRELSSSACRGKDKDTRGLI